MSYDITSELLTSGAPAVKFEQEGDVRKIKIADITKQQETDFDTGEPITWPNGQPKYQFVITGTINGDEVRLFVKGYMVDALRDALRKANVKPGDSLNGGTLTVKWESTDEPRRKGMNGARRYVAKFEPAPAGIVDDDLI
jgi:hypothetical protein